VFFFCGVISVGENLPEVAMPYLRVFSACGQLPQRTAGGTTAFGAESCQARQQKQNFVYRQMFCFCLSKPQAWHIITTQSWISSASLGLYIITRQRVFSCGLMIYNTLC